MSLPLPVAPAPLSTLNPGSALASLWIMTSQEQDLPVSTAAAAMVPSIATCPCCGMHFSQTVEAETVETAPQQSCNSCGWAEATGSS